MVLNACLPMGAAAGEGDPLSFFAGASKTHDDNIFKSPPASGPVAESVLNTYAGLVFDTHASRQEFHAEVSGNSTSYDRLKYLDNTGSHRQVSWHGALGHNLTTDFNWNRNAAQAGFSDFRATIKNIVTTDNRLFRLQYKVTPDWAVKSTFTDGSTKNGATSNQVADSHVTTAEFSLGYASPLGNGVSVNLRRSNGEYPNRQLVAGLVNTVDNSYAQTDSEVSVIWAASGATRVSMRGARTRREHNDIPQRDFSGYTGEMSWDWTPGAKSAVSVFVKRDLGAADELLANYSVVRVVGASGQWQLSSKISTSLRLEQRRRVFGGDPRFVVTGASVPGDVTRSASLAAQYAATRSFQLSLSLKHETRESENPLLPYASNAVTLGGQMTF